MVVTVRNGTECVKIAVQIKSLREKLNYWMYEAVMDVPSSE